MYRFILTLTALVVTLVATAAVPEWSRAAVPPGNDPHGAYDLAASPPGQVRVAGWSFDPNVPTDPIAVHVYVDGTAGAPGVEGTFETAKRGDQPVCVCVRDQRRPRQQRLSRVQDHHNSGPQSGRELRS